MSTGGLPLSGVSPEPETLRANVGAVAGIAEFQLVSKIFPLALGRSGAELAYVMSRLVVSLSQLAADHRECTEYSGQILRGCDDEVQPCCSPGDLHRHPTLQAPPHRHFD